MDKRTDSIIRQYISSVANQTPGFVTAYLFGSFAKNNQRPESDIDIALIIDNLRDSDKFDIQVQLMLLAAKFDSRIEPHPLSRQDFLSDNPFVYEIVKTGIEIK
ncbi:MAG: nucleotidyltransferase domain-containing protein [Bacteroidales bacterium]|nr:nucleotidyltransferase domain-containing protein [Bacteroidales bacterium]